MALTCGEIVSGISVAVEIGSGVSVDGIDEAVNVGGTGEEDILGAHALMNTIVSTSARDTDRIDLFKFEPSGFHLTIRINKKIIKATIPLKYIQRI
jgi:hypothetical protein